MARTVWMIAQGAVRVASGTGRGAAIAQSMKDPSNASCVHRISVAAQFGCQLDSRIDGSVELKEKRPRS